MRFFMTKRQECIILWLIFRWASPTAIIQRSFRAITFTFLKKIKKQENESSERAMYDSGG
jgi:hypothetical protein